MNQPIPKPKIVAFELTQRCPLNCRHCRASASADTADYLTTDQCKKILAALSNFNKCIVILPGGEPMVRDDIYELIQYGACLGLRIVMATCGFDLDENALVRLKSASLLSLSFSLDGADAQTHDSFRQKPGAFDNCLAAIEKSRNANLRFQINTTITKHNIDHLPAIASLAEKLGAACFNPFILVPVGRADHIRDLLIPPDDYEKLLNHLADLKQKSKIDVRVTCGPQFARICRQKSLPNAEKVTGCLAATDFAFISAKGDVQTCGFLNISAGNLIENNFDFADIWQNSPFLNELRDHNNYHGACASCAYLNSCRGCRARAFATLGDYLAHDPICKIAQNFNNRNPSP